MKLNILLARRKLGRKTSKILSCSNIFFRRNFTKVFYVFYFLFHQLKSYLNVLRFLSFYSFATRHELVYLIKSPRNKQASSYYNVSKNMSPATKKPRLDACTNVEIIDIEEELTKCDNDSIRKRQNAEWDRILTLAPLTHVYGGTGVFTTPLNKAYVTEEGGGYAEMDSLCGTTIKGLFKFSLFPILLYGIFCLIHRWIIFC